MKPHCMRCGRSLKRPVLVAGASYGSTCVRLMFGIKPRRSRRVKVDERTADLFAEVRA